MYQKTVAQLRKALDNKEISSVELTRLFLERIKSVDPQLNAFITVTEELALKQAEEADKKIADGQAQSLTGIPIAQKDIFCTKDVATTAGSKMLANFISPYESEVTQRFINAGAVMLGKTNMDEFAMGSSNETSYFGAVKNPWNLECIPGGSSGGSSSAVAARLAPAATGTDTGGSIRQPAAMCGITGLKPTYGRVSRFGMIAFASSLDQAGPMTHTAEDAAMLMQVMAGHDSKDSTSINQSVPDYLASLNQNIEGLKIGIPKEYFGEGIDNEVGASIETAIAQYEKLGAKICEVSLPNTKLAVPSYYVVAPAEASSNLSRFDGVRYGYRCQDPKNLEDLYKRSRGEGFGEEVKRRILVGTYALSAGYYDAYYLKAQKVRRLISQDFQKAFEEVDMLLSPTAPTTAFKIGEKTQDPIAMYMSDINTIAVNLAGICGLSMPCGVASNGLPIGVQLIGNYFDEGKLLNAAHQYQQHTNWHNQVPEAVQG